MGCMKYKSVQLVTLNAIGFNDLSIPPTLNEAVHDVSEMLQVANVHLHGVCHGNALLGMAFLVRPDYRIAHV